MKCLFCKQGETRPGRTGAPPTTIKRMNPEAGFAGVLVPR